MNYSSILPTTHTSHIELSGSSATQNIFNVKVVAADTSSKIDEKQYMLKTLRQISEGFSSMTKILKTRNH